jgi:penicillin-binding protein-related factor A (putative recombinase)
VSPRDETAIGRTRIHTGRAFEAELDLAHRYYELMKWGKIRRHFVPTRFVKGARQAAGVAHVDRSGWVRVQQLSPTARYVGSYPAGEVIPVAFDAKVLAIGETTYRHPKTLQHQLLDLKAAAEAGEYAFLLIQDREHECLYALPILEHFTALLDPRRGVALRNRYPRPMVPMVYKRLGGGSTPGWDWIPLLHHCAPTMTPAPCK